MIRLLCDRNAPLRATPRRRRDNARGFSLIELMVAIGIIGLLAALAVSLTAEAVRLQRGRSEISRVRYALVDLRNAARVTRRCMAIHVDTAANQIRGTPYLRCDGGVLEDPVTDDVRVFSFEPAIRVEGFGSDRRDLVFNEEGGTLEADAVTVTVTLRETGEQHQYAVLPAIGSVREVQ